MPQTTNDAISREFSWSAALLGGSVAIAGGAFFGTLISVVSVRLLMSRGSTAEQAYVTLASSGFTPLTSLSVLLALLSGVLGGYVAAKYGGERRMLQALVASACPILFTLVMYLSPSSQLGPAWYIVYTFVAPVVTSAIGAALCERRI
jgi:nitrate/nitrite transporter NarK